MNEGLLYEKNLAVSFCPVIKKAVQFRKRAVNSKKSTTVLEAHIHSFSEASQKSPGEERWPGGLYD